MQFTFVPIAQTVFSSRLRSAKRTIPRRHKTFICGIGRAVALAFAKEGADVAIGYLNEDGDAKQTKGAIEQLGRRCLAIAGDIGEESTFDTPQLPPGRGFLKSPNTNLQRRNQSAPTHCVSLFGQKLVEQTVKEFGHLDILLNNAAEQHPQESIEDITAQQLERTFRTNIFSMFYLTKAALKHLKEGSAIINTTSVTAYKGNEKLLDYSSTKGAIVAFTRSLSQSLVEKGIRVNGVAPGPIWTPLIPATFPAEKVEKFGTDTPLGRAGQPDEVAPSYVFLASKDSSYMTGQILHPNGGSVVNG